MFIKVHAKYQTNFASKTHLVCRFPLRDARVNTDRLESATIEYPYRMNNKEDDLRGYHLFWAAIKNKGTLA